MAKKPASQDLSALTVDPSLAPVLALKPATKKAMENKYEDPLEGMTQGRLVRLLACSLMGQDASPFVESKRHLIGVPFGEQRQIAELDTKNSTYRLISQQDALIIITELLDEQRTTYTSETFGEPDLDLSYRGKLDVIHEIISRSGVDPSNFAPVGFKSDRRVVGHRFPFDPLPATLQDVKAAYPTVYELLARMERPDLYCRFWYEALTGTGSKKQMLWNYGSPNAMKTSAICALGAALGSAFRVLSSRSFHDTYRWLGAEIKNARLVFIDECNPKIFQWDQFKAVTGASTYMVEEKGQPAYQMSMEARFIAASQHAPDLDTSSEDQVEAGKARLLLNKVDAHPNPPSGSDWEAWKANLTKEIIGIVEYGMSCAGAQLPPQDVSRIIEADPMYELANCFVKDPQAIIPAHKLTAWAMSKGLNQTNGLNRLKRMLREVFGADTNARTKTERFVKGVRFF